nr:2-Cys peroxiredoxin BAS1-like, chloroplastic [Tanacetum cinerariifolium]
MYALGHKSGGGLGVLKWVWVWMLKWLGLVDEIGDMHHVRVLGLARRVLQFVQDNLNEVCPARWKPREKSMKPDPKLSKEDFTAA